MSPSSPDQDLVASALLGDRRAFDELVCRHREGVISVVYRMCGDPGLAEDAAQEAFVRAWQNLNKYKPQFSFRNWVYKIAVNLAYDELRRQPAGVDLEDTRLQSGNGEPEKALEELERNAQVRRAMLALPHDSRAALVLREFEGLSYQEIANTLGIPIGTVMSRLNYARNRLRESLTEFLEDK